MGAQGLVRVPRSKAFCPTWTAFAVKDNDDDLLTEEITQLTRRMKIVVLEIQQTCFLLAQTCNCSIHLHRG